MSQPTIPFPDRPLRVRPPGAGLGSQLWAVAWAAIVLGALAWLVIRPIGDLLTDRSLVGKAQPVPGAKVDGRCSVHLAVVTSCDATLTVSRSGLPDRSRQVDYFFVDFHTGDYEIEVVADPARPDLLSSDLALDKITNRTVTLVVLGPLFLLIGVIGIGVARRTVGRQRATLRALSRQVLRPVLLRMDHYAVGQWTVSAPPPARPRPMQWNVPKRARPIVMDPERKAVLGVTAGDGRITMPLDAELSWIDLAADERRRLLDELGPDRFVGGGYAALDSDEGRMVRTRLRRTARTVTIAGLVFAAVAGGAAWVAFREPDTGPGEMVELRQGDEAPHGEAIKLRGVWHTDRAARVGVPDGKLARLEVWVAVTAPDWHDSLPVTWVVRDGSMGMATSGLTTRAGRLLAGELTADVLQAFEREHLLLSGSLRLLDVPAAPPDPLRMPALVALILGAALALGLLLVGAIVGARYRREAAILQPRRT